MKTFLLILFVLLSNFYVFSQDTVFADAYAKGLVTGKIETKRAYYIVFPVESPEYRIAIHNSEISKICYANGNVFNNSDYEKSEMVVLETDPLTGEIFYSKIFEFENSTKKSLYSKIKKINGNPSSDVRYKIISDDPLDKNSIVFEVSYPAKYAGDDALIVITLEASFKDDKVRCVLKDFYVGISWKKYSFGSSTATHLKKDNLERLEKYYPRARGDTKKFWVPISENNHQIFIDVLDALNKTDDEW